MLKACIAPPRRSSSFLSSMYPPPPRAFRHRERFPLLLPYGFRFPPQTSTSGGPCLRRSTGLPISPLRWTTARHSTARWAGRGLCPRYPAACKCKILTCYFPRLRVLGNGRCTGIPSPPAYCFPLAVLLFIRVSSSAEPSAPRSKLVLFCRMVGSRTAVLSP